MKIAVYTIALNEEQFIDLMINDYYKFIELNNNILPIIDSIKFISILLSFFLLHITFAFA